MNFDNTLAVCGTIIAVISSLAIATYHINDRILMAKNIDNAISKGIDPVAVRCAYAQENDVVCVAFAASGKEIVVQSKK
jgi:hypothetical protein